MRNLAAMWLVPLLGAGCGGVVAAGPDETQQALVASNGVKQNGVKQNGVKQNGSGMQITGVNLATAARLHVIPPVGGTGDLSIANQTPLGASLYQSTIVVPTTTVPLSTNGLIFDATFTDGTAQVTGQAYVEGEPWADVSDNSIKYYNVRNHFYAPDGTEVWGYICGTQTQPIINLQTGQVSYITLPVPATAVAGQWDYHEGVRDGGSKTIEMSDPRSSQLITFACIDGAIGKCVGMGYKPWEPTTECTGSILLGNYRCIHATRELEHEACVRMVRADYCGDGMPHTLDGMSIDLWDPTNVETQTTYGATDTATTVPWGHEAEWTPKGARCLSQLLMSRVAGGRISGTVKQYLGLDWCKDKWPKSLNGGAFAWDNGDCFGEDSTFYVSRVPFLRSGPNNYTVAMDLHDRVWIRNKSVCVDDSYRNTAKSTLPAQPGVPYSPWPTNYNGDRYSLQWCGHCLVDPDIPSAATCGVTDANYY